MPGRSALRTVASTAQSFRRAVFPTVNRDGKVVIAAAAVRSLDYGFISVFIGVYLSELGFSAFEAGLVFSAIMAGATLSNVVASWRGDAIGRRRMLVAMAALMGVGGVLFPLTEHTALLMGISLIAMTTSTGGDRSAFLSLDMAILAEAGRPQQRTAVFSLYNLIGRLTKAIGSLLIAVPVALQNVLGVEPVTSLKLMFFAYAFVALAGVAIYWLLSAESETSRSTSERAQPMPRSSRTIMIQLAALFSLDSLGGGFMVYSFMSYFFANRFGMGVETIALIFFGGQMLNTVSILLAAPTARRVGLIMTMAASQGLANSMMVLMALTGNPALAVSLFMARELINDMDIPTRQSYSMAIVPPDARTATASVTNLGRTLAQTVTPALAGFVAQTTALGVPIVIGSAIKLVYNGALYAMFRSVAAPEEDED